jgi:hypothetical protein
VKRTNYGFEKRQKDLKKQKKREAKNEKKRLRDAPPSPELEELLQLLFAEGRAIGEQFRGTAEEKEFHAFAPANYDQVLAALLPHRASGGLFLEWGSGPGVITIMADLLGFDAFGIEIDAGLVEAARGLADKFDSSAEFVAGSFLPEGYRWESGDGVQRMGTIGSATPGYPDLGHSLAEFDTVFAYPWGGEEAMMIDLMSTRGSPDATLLLHTVAGTIDAYKGGQLG